MLEWDTGENVQTLHSKAPANQGIWTQDQHDYKVNVALYCVIVHRPPPLFFIFVISLFQVPE